MATLTQLEQHCHQFTQIASKSSLRLRSSDNHSCVSLTTIYNVGTRHVDRKDASSVDITMQASDPSGRPSTPKTSAPAPITTCSSSSSPFLQSIALPDTSSQSPTLSLQPRRRSTLHQSSPFLTIIPHDLHHVLAVKYLDFDTLLSLRQTCRTMHDLLTPQLVRRVRSAVIQESLKVEEQQFTSYRSIYPRQRLGHLWDLLYYAFDFRLIERPATKLPCYGCLETKPLWAFVERMSIKGTGLGARYARDRMCKDCMRRYRHIEGFWWKENWVKKSDTVRKSTRTNRIKGWVVHGGSLVNPDQEVGVCSSCGCGSFELWWGCKDCFELEERRRREEDLEDFYGWQRKVVDVLEAWRVRKEGKRRQRVARRERSRGRNRWWTLNIDRSNWEWQGGLNDRLAALLEWTEHKTQPKSPNAASRASITPEVSQSNTQPWRAIDQIPLPENRRVSRCSSCWVPNCPRRTYMLGLAYERYLPQDRWCKGCQADFEARRAKRRQCRQSSRPRQSGGPPVDIFSDGWLDGFGDLFDDHL